MKLKIVFFGASLAGKSTTVRKLYEILKDVKILTTPGQFRLNLLRKAILQGLTDLCLP